MWKSQFYGNIYGLKYQLNANIDDISKKYKVKNS